MKAYIKQVEDNFDETMSKSIAEMIDYGAPTRDFHQRFKTFQRQTIIGLLEQECDRLEGMKKDEGSKNLSDTQIAINWANPVYNLALQDQINYYQQQIKELTSSTGQ